MGYSFNDRLYQEAIKHFKSSRKFWQKFLATDYQESIDNSLDKSTCKSLTREVFKTLDWTIHQDDEFITTAFQYDNNRDKTGWS